MDALELSIRNGDYSVLKIGGLYEPLYIRILKLRVVKNAIESSEPTELIENQPQWLQIFKACREEFVSEAFDIALGPESEESQSLAKVTQYVTEFYKVFNDVREALTKAQHVNTNVEDQYKTANKYDILQEAIREVRAASAPEVVQGTGTLQVSYGPDDVDLSAVNANPVKFPPGVKATLAFSLDPAFKHRTGSGLYLSALKRAARVMNAEFGASVAEEVDATMNDEIL